MSNSQTKEIRRWLNRPQMIALASMIRILAVRAGRRLGKTEEIGAERTIRPAWLLKGSSGFTAAKSYSKLLDDMMPGLIAGWAKRKIVEDVDYVIGKTPPKHFKRPILPPLKYDHYISFRWGSGMHLVSMDYGITRNGQTTDWGLIDECKQIDPVRLDSELLKTMSGHGSMLTASGMQWRNLPEHQSLTLLTDAFIGKYDFDWINRYQQESISMEEAAYIMFLNDEWQKSNNEAVREEMLKLQCKSVLYLQASTEENLAYLGAEYFEQQAKSSTPIDFRTSILNEEVKQIEGGFYKFLDEDIHTYEARDNNRIDSIGISDYIRGVQKNSLLDKDWNPNLPLIVAVDYGSTHCWFLVAQFYSKTHWFMNNFWTTNEQIIEGVDKVCAYYKHHTHKVIDLRDDPGGHKKNTDQERDVQKVISRFKHHGWTVKHKTASNNYIPHNLKYRICEYGLDERKGIRNEQFSKARFNMNNCYETFYSCSKAPVIIGRKDEFGKDKRMEGNKNIEQWKATHLSDCFDMIYCTDNLHLIDNSSKWFTW